LAPEATITRHVISPYRDQTNQTAARRLFLPLLDSCSVNPSVTASLYSRTVCRALRRTLRGPFGERRTTPSYKIFLPSTQAMYACTSRTGTDFPRACAHPAGRARIFKTYPPPPIALKANGTDRIFSAPLARLGRGNATPSSRLRRGRNGPPGCGCRLGDRSCVPTRDSLSVPRRSSRYDRLLRHN
jgi:hypothetical protein